MQTLLVLFFWDFKRLVIYNSLKNCCFRTFLWFSILNQFIALVSVRWHLPAEKYSRDPLWNCSAITWTNPFIAHSLRIQCTPDRCARQGFFSPSINCKVLWFLYLGKCYEIKAYKVGKHVLLKYNVGRISYLGKQVHWFQLWNFVHRDVMGNWK